MIPGMTNLGESKSLPERCIEAAARLFIERNLPSLEWDRQPIGVQAAARLAVIPYADAVLAEVAAWCDDRADLSRKDGDVAEYGLRIAAVKCREGA